MASSRSAQGNQPKYASPLPGDNAALCAAALSLASPDGSLDAHRKVVNGSAWFLRSETVTAVSGDVSVASQSGDVALFVLCRCPFCTTRHASFGARS